MRQYCSVCNGQYDMTVVRESAEDGVIWLKCPHCQGILPHMPESFGGGATEAEPVVSPSEATQSDPLEDIDVESARPYEPNGRYALGDVVHHRGWNDFGVVVAKEELPGNRNVIRVRFAENGEVQLIEGGA
jgi:hypothetical protein